MRKNFYVIILITILTIFLVGCTNTNTTETTNVHFNQEMAADNTAIETQYFRSTEKYEFKKACLEEPYYESNTPSIEPAEKVYSMEYTEIFNQIERDEIEYVNTKYNLNLKAEEISVYFSDTDTSDAVYLSNFNYVIISKVYKNTNMTDYLYGVMCHEAFHHIYFHNYNTKGFGYINGEQRLTHTTTEALNQMMTLNYLNDTNQANIAKQINVASNNIIVVFDLLSEITQADFVAMYISNDIDTFKNLINDTISNNAIIPNKHSAFENFMFTITAFEYTNLQYNYYVNVEHNSEEAAKFEENNNKYGYALMEMCFVMGKGKKMPNIEAVLTQYMYFKHYWNNNLDYDPDYEFVDILR